MSADSYPADSVDLGTVNPRPSSPPFLLLSHPTLVVLGELDRIVAISHLSASSVSMTLFISGQHLRLARSFAELDAQLRTSTRFHDQLSTDEIQNEFDRYKAWAENVGAAQSGHNYKFSLDYRLREASFYKDHVCNHTLMCCIRLAI